MNVHGLLSESIFLFHSLDFLYTNIVILFHLEWVSLRMFPNIWAILQNWCKIRVGNILKKCFSAELFMYVGTHF